MQEVGVAESVVESGLVEGVVLGLFAEEGRQSGGIAGGDYRLTSIAAKARRAMCAVGS